MRSRGLIVHAILALGGMTAAYLVWTSEEELENPDAVTILECDEDDFERVELTLDDKETVLALTREDGALAGWFTVTRRPEEGAPSTRQFASVGGEPLTEYLGHLAPLRANRSLGDLSEEELEQTGLDEPAGQLAVTCGGTRTVFVLGGRSYGTGDRYGRAESGGPVYLISRDSVQPLESAEHQMMQRALHELEWSDVDHLQLSAFGSERTLRQRNRHGETGGEWVDAAEPDRRNELYANWIALYRRLRVQDYLSPDSPPGSDLDASGTPSPVLTMELFGDDGSLDRVEIVRVDANERAYYARTRTTQSWVRLPASVAREVEEDVRPVLGLEPLEPEPEPEAPPAEGTPTEGAATEGAPTEGASTEGASTEGASTEGASTEGAPAEGASPPAPPAGHPPVAPVPQPPALPPGHP